ncbi:MAG: L-serine ammonia-lyase [Planctomycetota bacterium]
MSDPITLRLLDIYRIGLGPSSSHTVGPLRAASAFRDGCLAAGLVPDRLEVELLGSLSATGRGHGTDKAVLAGLLGWDVETCDVDAFQELPETLREAPWGSGVVPLSIDDIRFLRYAEYKHEELPHPNTMRLTAWKDGARARHETWCSVGGGFVRRADRMGAPLQVPSTKPLLPWHDANTIVAQARAIRGTLGDVVLRNEKAWEREPGEIERGLDKVWAAFRACIDRGLAREGELPGGLGVKRRGASLQRRVEDGRVESAYTHIARAQSYAFAVNEENAAGGRVVTAPTNGAAGVLPGVLVEVADRMGLTRPEVHNALATAAAIAKLVKTHSSISGAEVGCQGEVGTATAMAAAALCQILGGGPRRVETAAEIAIEHNLGLTCDPIRGLVQAPCIERNAMGVAKAWSAAQLSLHSTLSEVVSLDRVIQVMKRTGDDMRREYKETSEGGLAVSLPEC